MNNRDVLGPAPHSQSRSGSRARPMSSRLDDALKKAKSCGDSFPKLEGSGAAALLSKSLRVRSGQAIEGSLTRLASLAAKHQEKKRKTFLGASRGIRLLIKVCIACRELLWYQVSSASWYKMIEDLNKTSELKSQQEVGIQNSFVVNIINPAGGEVSRLEFDVMLYKRSSPTSRTSKSTAIEALCKRPDSRTRDDIEQIMLHCRRASAAFQSYPLEQQRLMAACSIYDRFAHQRVILREGLHPGGFYFVLNGTLIETETSTAAARIIQAGEKFGEDDLKQGRRRQTTVVTTNAAAVELLYIYKEDYNRIFHRIANLDKEQVKMLCRKDSFMEIYPMYKILDNSTICVTLKFKYNRLICADSNTTEYIYVVMSGKAKAIQKLSARDILNAKTRRPADRLPKEIYAQWAFPTRQKMLSPPVIGARSNKNAEAGWRDRPTTSAGESSDVAWRSPHYLQVDYHHDRPRPKTSVGKPVQAVESKLDGDEEVAAGDGSFQLKRLLQNRLTTSIYAGTSSATLKYVNGNEPRQQMSSSSLNIAQCTDYSRAGVSQGKSSNVTIRQQSFAKPAQKLASSVHGRPQKKNDEDCVFLEVRLLQPGHVFGLRACLPEDERGSSAALVSAGCEVMQIQKAFFEKHLDENLIGVLRLKVIPFPNADEVVTQLRRKQEWQMYKDSVMTWLR